MSNIMILHKIAELLTIYFTKYKQYVFPIIDNKTLSKVNAKASILLKENTLKG